MIIGHIANQARSLGAGLLIVALAAGLLTACVPATEADEPLDCATAGFPCSWADAPADAQRASLEVLETAGRLVDSGMSPLDVADELRTAPGVVVAIADETGVQLRVEGGPIVVAFAPETHPLASAILSGEVGDAAGEEPESGSRAPADEDAAAHSPQVLTASAATPAISTAPQSLSVSLDLPPSEYAPTREPGIRPRTALMIRPFEQFDAMKVFNDLVAAGLVEPDADPAALDLDDYGLGTAAGVLGSSPYVADLVRAVDDSAFLDLGDYDIVYIQSHSSTFDPSDGCDVLSGHVCGQVVGGFPITSASASVTDALEEIAFLPSDRLPQGATIGRVMGVWTVAFTPDFFRQNYGGSNPVDAIVFLNACSSAAPIAAGFGGSLMSGLASLVDENHGPAVFGWTSLSSALPMDRASATVMAAMLRDGASAAQAYTFAASDPAVLAHEVAGRTAEMRFAGRDLRARDAVAAEQGGSEIRPGAILDVEGEPEDGRDDSLVQLELRVDGVVRGEEEDAVLTWQLVGRHDQPLVIEDPFTSAPGRQVVELQPAEVGPTLAVPWVSYRITLTDLDLGFDLRDEEVTRETGLGFPLRVEVAREGGQPSRHTVDPVQLRLVSVYLVDPDLGQELESGDLVELDGAPDDGRAEEFPLRVRMQRLAPETRTGSTLHVRFGDREFSYPAADWQPDGDDFVVTDVIDLGDFAEHERSYSVEVWVEAADGAGIAQHVVDPLDLILASDPCEVLTARQVSTIMGRPFALAYLGGDDDFLGAILGDVCAWESANSSVQLSVSPGTRGLVEAVEGGDPRAVAGLGDAALYDLEVGNAENPSGRLDPDTGEMRWNNFVVLDVAIGHRRYVVNVQGNIVIDDGPAGVLERLRDLFELIDP